MSFVRIFDVAGKVDGAESCMTLLSEFFMQDPKIFHVFWKKFACMHGCHMQVFPARSTRDMWECKSILLRLNVFLRSTWMLLKYPITWLVLCFWKNPWSMKTLNFWISNSRFPSSFKIEKIGSNCSQVIFFIDFYSLLPGFFEIEIKNTTW